MLARLLGDPDSVFYLVQIDPDGEGACLGCNIYDHTRLSPAGNFIVSLGGLLFTQATALIALFLMPHSAMRSIPRRFLSAIALGFAFLDIPVQVLQSLLYNLERHTFPTNVDLMDAMLLVSRATGASQGLLKAILAVLAVAYLYFFWRKYRRNRAKGNVHPVQAFQT